ncbi:hypothetical protein ACFY7H_33505 [Streptomyces sp. NPDC012794]|uniref:hypothetical protein n=1 Tax=Streptomyces sp. NPDC012794 TaxID=3364850 RepID=UPI0036C2B102
MRCSLIALRVAGAAVALTAFTAVTAPAALANEWDRGGVSAEPNPAAPGAHVKIRVRGCHGDWGVARSPVFVSDVRLSSRHGDGRTLWGEATVRSHADPGRHEIRVKCEGADGLRGSIDIRHRDHHHRPDPHRSPVWPVHAGGGGMSAEVAGATRPATAAEKSHDGDGPGLPHTVIGAVLAAAATLAVAGRAITLRRRRNGG